MDAIDNRWMASARERALLIGGLALVALLARIPFLGNTTNDADLYIVPWFEWIASVGYRALGEGVPNALGSVQANYTPPYYYLMLLVAPLKPFVPTLWLIKAISIAFDLLAAFFAFKIVRLYFSPTRALLAAAAVLLAPTLIANSAWWGQCDVIWVSLILGAFYFTTVRKPLAAVILFGIGLSFKAHAFFFAPYLFMLFLRGEVRLWHFACVPLVYAAMMMPAVLLGRSWMDVFSVYLRQAEHFRSLSMSAPNLYYFVPNEFYTAGVAVGLTATTLASAVLAYLPRLKRAQLDEKALVLAATMFVALSVFLLPKMHDRYFLAADLFSIVLVFFVPRLWLVAVGFQISSMAAYVPNITFSLTGSATGATVPMAAMLNTVLVAFLVTEFWRICTRPGSRLGETMETFATAGAAVIGANIVWIAVALTQDLLFARLCPGAEGLVGFAVCEWEVPVNITYASWTRWPLFFAILAASWVVARVAVARVWRWDWRGFGERLGLPV